MKNQSVAPQIKSKIGRPDPGDRTQGTILSIANTPSSGRPYHLTGEIKMQSNGDIYQFVDACFYNTFGKLSDEEIIGMSVWCSFKEVKVAGNCQDGYAVIWIANELSNKA